MDSIINTVLAPATILAAVTYLAKSMVSLIVSLNKKRASIEVLIAYLDRAIDNYDDHFKNNGESHLKVAEKIRETEGYTPFIPFEDETEFSANDIRKSYDFLSIKDSKLVTDYILIENFVYALCKDFRTEIVLNFEQERKAKIYELYIEVGVESLDKAMQARSALYQVKEMRYLAFGKYILFQS